MKVAFGMIVFQSDFVLKECLDSIYPFASQILVAEGPVDFFYNKGFETSSDETNSILDGYDDRDKKITIVHGHWKEKDEECNAYMKYLNDDIDYLWQVDSDEIYKEEDVANIISLLEKENPTSVGVKPISFYGGLNKYITGFEQNVDNFLRIFKVTPGCSWKTHRPPTIRYPQQHSITEKHITSEELFEKTNAVMYHYSYVFPIQVRQKIEYYKAKVSGNKCIENYFESVWLRWTLGDDEDKEMIEDFYNGIHEFKPEYRGHSRTKNFTGTHPTEIEKNKDKIKERIARELNEII